MNKGEKKNAKKSKTDKKDKEKDKEKEKSENKSEKKEKKHKQKKEKKEGEPKKPPTAYFLFCADKRKENKDKKWPAKELGELFNGLSEEEKEFQKSLEETNVSREDYNKLLTIGPKVFEKPYYFQNMATEEGKYIYFYSKLCNSHTTARSEEDYAAGQNCGIFIDIFTLDNLPDGNFARNLHLFRLRTITKMARFCCPHTFPAKQGVVKNVKMQLNHLQIGRAHEGGAI